MYIEWFDLAPLYIIIVIAHMDVIMQPVPSHLVYHMWAEVDGYDPAIIIFDLIVPVLIVAIIRAVEDEYILTYENKFIDA